MTTRGLVRLFGFIKIRTYAKSDDELWRDEWHNPLERQLSVTADVARDLKKPFGDAYMWGSDHTSAICPLMHLNEAAPTWTKFPPVFSRGQGH